MKLSVTICTQRATTEQISSHLIICDHLFTPHLSSRININEYSEKLHRHAQRFEAWVDTDLIGLVAVYANDIGNKKAFISSVSIAPSFQRTGIAKKLLSNSIAYIRELDFTHIKLKVNKLNNQAIELYKNQGFIAIFEGKNELHMEICLSNKQCIK